MRFFDFQQFQIAPAAMEDLKSVAAGLTERNIPPVAATQAITLRSCESMAKTIHITSPFQQPTPCTSNERRRPIRGGGDRVRPSAI